MEVYYLDEDKYLKLKQIVYTFNKTCKCLILTFKKQLSQVISKPN